QASIVGWECGVHGALTMHPPGMKDALNGLQDLPAGGLVLLIVALGLIAFSVYSFAQAAWRRINMDVPDAPEAVTRHFR
ncbi:DUF1206 domain-containing protein, partial [Pseudomonas syringae]